jgi:hypothetical protein
MIEAVSTSATSVNVYQTTWRSSPEDSHLRTRCRENLKAHILEGRVLRRIFGLTEKKQEEAEESM